MTPIMSEWNEEAQFRNLNLPVYQNRYGNFFDGMFSIVNGYNKKIPQLVIDGFARKYQFLKLQTKDDSDDWMLSSTTIGKERISKLYG